MRRIAAKLERAVKAAHEYIVYRLRASLGLVE
jgi:hypothetical protein